MQIKEVAALTGISAYTIRFYEKKQLLTVNRDANAIRDFDKTTINRLRWIACYRRSGLAIKDIKRIVDGNLSLPEFLQILDDAKERLTAEINSLQYAQDCLTTKRIATINGEPLSDITVCAPSPDEIDKRYAKRLDS